MDDTHPHSVLPDGFHFGVATAGFQIEGGYNGRHEPSNNWLRFEQTGRVEPSGIALNFWNDYETQLDQVVALGCNAFRLSIEWARCEPAEGEIDDDALVRYIDIIDACRERGLEPLVTLHHFTHPTWAGEDFWLDATSPERFARWASFIAERIANRVRYFVTINEWNIYALQTYVTGDFPPARTGDVHSAIRTMDHLLAAHVGAYNAIHDVRPDTVVATNGFAFSTYGLERLATDILEAKSHEVERPELRQWLASRRARYEGALPNERIMRWVTQRFVDLDRAFPRTVDAVYASPHISTLDHIQTDYYNPKVSSHFRLPGHQSAGGRHWFVDRQLWDDPVDPRRFGTYLDLLSTDGRPIWVVENGLCNRKRNGHSIARVDGWNRPRYLQAHLAALVNAIDRGVNIGGYFHWTLADNYEWGSYEPCFGIFHVDRARGNTWSSTDAMGHHSGRAYRRLIEGLTAGDRSVLQCPVSELTR